MTTEQLPAPMVPAEVDLRDFAFMPLDVLRLRDSDLASVEDAEVFRCAVLSWCVSWHQTPAGSLPDDDVLLARLLGFGRDIKGWRRVRAAGGMRGWVLCSDGRLYHPVVAEKARDAWVGKMAQRWRTECARIKKHNQRHKLEGDAAVQFPDFDVWMSQGCPQGQPLHVPGTKADGPKGQGPSVPRETASKGQGEGQGQGQGEEVDNPQPPEGGKRKAKPKADGAVCLRTWLDAGKAKGEQPVPPDDPVFAYAGRAGIPREFLSLAWRQFRHRYTEQHPGKRYRDWRRVFRNAVEGNWLKLWWLDPGTQQYGLTTVGLQAQRALEQPGGKAA